MKQSVSLSVVGLGPGQSQCLTPMARSAISRSGCIVGYPLYLDLLPPELTSGKEIIATGMRQEEDRCRRAIAACLQGTITSLVCSGDPGIYALAGLVLEILEQDQLLNSVELEIVPGVPAVCAAAALLGAPLMHDFACISLSDLLTPKELIEKRIRAALAADFVTVLYNPRSHGRPDHLAWALQLALQYRDPSTPVGLVRKAFRPGQRVSTQPLARFSADCADMLSIVLIGNSTTRLVGPYMLTPRGYQLQK